MASIDENREFTDGEIEDEIVAPLVELFSVGLLAKTTRGEGPVVYRATDIAKARVRAWRAS